MIAQLGLIIIFIAIIIYVLHMCSIYFYWKKRGVAGPTPYPIVGNYGNVIFGIESEGDLLRKLYEQYPNEKFVGIYKGIRPVLVIRDPDMIKCVLIKDFDSFRDRCTEKPLHIFDKGMFTMRGTERWQAMRLTLSPSFTKSKLAKMIPYVQKATDRCSKFVDYLINNKVDQEIRNLTGKYMVEIIGNLVFGVDLDAKDGNKEFQKAINALLDPCLLASPIHTIEYICPPIIDILNPLIRRELYRRVYGAFHRFVTLLIYQERDKLNPAIIGTMIDLKESSKLKNGRTIPDIDDEDIVQQTLTFCLASYESTSTVMAFMIHELALKQDIQDKCYNEVKTVFEKYNGELNLEALCEMKYLDMALDESVRVHPTSHYLDRKCVAKYTFPNTNVTIDKSIFIYFPTHGLNRDPKYFPNPDVFDPERFSPENKAKIQPCVYLPFGEGPRMCLGPRLAKIFLQVCLASFLQKYKVSPSAKTKPIRYDPAKWFAVGPLGGLWVNIEPRN